MATNFPASLDDGTTLPDPSSGQFLNSPSHSSQHGNENGAVKAVEAKLGIGATTPSANTFLRGTGTGASAWGSLTSAQLAAAVSDETGSGFLVFATTPTLVTPKVDTINEATPANGVTVSGLNIKTGKLNTVDSVVTANYTDGSILPEHLVTGSGTSWASQSWTPTWTNRTTTSDVNASTYFQIGKLVYCYLSLTLGASSTMGTSAYFTLPVTAKTLGFDATFGALAAFDTSATSSYMISANWRSTTTAFIRSPSSGLNTGTTATNPFTWAVGDGIFGYFTYEAA